MVTSSQFRALALSLPGAEEKSHFGKADFRVKNKIFAGFSAQPECGYFKARPELQDELVGSGVGVFSAASGAWGRSGWTLVELQQVELALLRELISHAWKLVAPVKLAAAHESEEPRRARPTAKAQPASTAKAKRTLKAERAGEPQRTVRARRTPKRAARSIG